MSDRRLDSLVAAAAARSPGAPAVRVAGETTDYAELDRLANLSARGLADLGVGPGDRVGIWVDKSAIAIAAMQGALRLGAAYVPIDPQSPAVRAASILDDCAVAAVFTTADRAASLAGTEAAGAPILLPDALPGEAPARASAGPDNDLAYILYTSGSTGKPKGVSISHRNALAFIDWAVDYVDAAPADRFSNHAPFHFDLSVLDLYAAFASGGCVCVVPPSSAYAPRQLVDFIRSEAITIWYSVPSALIIMMEHGDLLEIDDLPLRHLLFAGEPFPIIGVRALRQRWPELPMHNLYGPTETNVCTAYTVGEIDPGRSRPVPIGRATCGDTVWAVTKSGERAEVGEQGELVVTGPTVMLGYYGHPAQGQAPYPTGDIALRIDEDNFEYIGRRDQMLKVRGHRIEAGEVEATLLTHEAVHEAAVVVHGSGIAARLVAYLVGDPQNRPSLIALKKLCAERLPRSMVIDRAKWLAEMPRTRNGKIDRLTLAKREL